MEQTCFKPGQVWNDTEGKAIQAHGGGILYHEGYYYWYGENKDIHTRVVPKIPQWDKTTKRYVHRTDLIGVSCYSSKDLLNWKNEGIVLDAEMDDYTHDLYKENVLERPKVIYNEKTKLFVMWMHVDTSDYQYARAGVAVSESPTGPFGYLGCFSPNSFMSRDMTVFKDDDGRAYLIFSSENNAVMHFCLLSDDYSEPTATYERNFIGKKREAPAIVKHEGLYYCITSGCTGWDPNEARYAVSESPLGPWTDKDNPCLGKGADKTFGGQSTYILPIEGKRKGCYIFMADKWKKEDLRDSRYIWLPMKFDEGRIEIKWYDEWSMETVQI